MPRGVLHAMPTAFHWLWEGEAVEFTLVLLDEQHREVKKLRAEGCELLVDDAMEQVLGAGGAFHWYVEAPQPEGVVRSPLAAFVISP